jgi:chitin disaccharide deacetylase
MRGCTQQLEGGVKRLIINADDFGLTGSVNRAVLKGFREAVITSATIMVNGPGYAEAVGISRGNPGLGVGVHLNILRSRPVLPPERIPSLVGPDGLFLRSTALLLRCFLRGRLNPREITEEFSAQIRKALSDGISVSHLDSEKHLHTLFIRPAIEAALKNGIRKIRLSRECAAFSPRGLLNKRFYVSLVIRAYARRARRLLAARGISHPDHFFGIQCSGEMLPHYLERLIAALPEGTSEIMTHPGRARCELEAIRGEFGSFDISARCKDELDALLSPRVRESIRRGGITLISYRDL